MAINFPTSPVNGDIHTAQGIQWQWDATGGTWKCQGVTGVYTLGIASASSLGGIKIGGSGGLGGYNGTDFGTFGGSGTGSISGYTPKFNGSGLFG